MNRKDGLACPRDQGRLTWYDAKGFGCHHCPQCSGLYVQQATLTGNLGHSPLAQQPLEKLADGDLACPACARTMKRVVHRETEIDICASCRAFWLDAGEWERIAKPANAARAARVAALAGAAAAGGVALGAVAASSTASPAQGTTMSAVGDVAGGVLSEAGGAAVEAVFEFLGEALTSLF